jgi:hypothetical protein
VAFVGEIEKFGRHLEPLQSDEKLKAFADIKPVIELPMHDQGGRFEFVGEKMRRPFSIKLALLPRRTAEFPFIEPKLFRRAIS